MVLGGKPIKSCQSLAVVVKQGLSEHKTNHGQVANKQVSVVSLFALEISLAYALP